MVWDSVEFPKHPGILNTVSITYGGKIKDSQGFPMHSMNSGMHGKRTFLEYMGQCEAVL